jgi:hypothetical protein
MLRKKTEMRKVKDILRFKFEVGLSNRDIGKCLNLGPATVSEVLTRFKSSDLSWPLPDSFSDHQLEGKLYTIVAAKRSKRLPDFTKMREELKCKGMTKLLLWQEYCEDDSATAYGYTQYCEYYQQWLKKQKRSMRQKDDCDTHLNAQRCRDVGRKYGVNLPIDTIVSCYVLVLNL